MRDVAAIIEIRLFSVTTDDLQRGEGDIRDAMTSAAIAYDAARWHLAASEHQARGRPMKAAGERLSRADPSERR